MALLILGLALFLGAHSVRIVADGWRSATIARYGDGAWKGAFTLVSLVGLALIIWGYGDARGSAAQLWTPPVWARHLAATIMFASAVALGAYIVRGGHVAAALRHPMLWSVILWSLAHLLANGSSADLALFGAFLVWAIADLVAARRRGGATVAPDFRKTMAGLLVGVAIWAAMVYGVHLWLFGAAPLG